MRRSIFLVLFIVELFSLSKAYAQPEPLASVPFILNNDHIIIRININDSDPINYLFDSGAGGTLITKFMAESLGLESTKKRKNIGVSGAHEVGLIKGVRLTLNTLDLGQVNLLETNTSFEEMDNGEKVHGVIGYPILSSYIVEIDYVNSTLNFYAQGSFNNFNSGAALPIRLDLNIPVIVAEIGLYNGVRFDGNFIVDTGARADIIISNPTVIQYGMAEAVGKHYTLRKKIGSSQRRTKLRYGRLKMVEIGEFCFLDTPVILSSDTKGVLSLPQLNGIIGNRLLQHFRVIFDYHNRYLYLEKKQPLGSKYFINASGFDLVFKEGQPFINNIVDRSAADLVGLHNGDLLISIDGKLSSNMVPDEIRKSLYKSGRTIKMVIKRNNRHKLFELLLENLI